MKKRNPLDRDDIRVNKNDYVLEVGPGHFPTYRANVLVEKFVDSNYHRSSDGKKYEHQKLIITDGDNMPFKDKEFDYVICCQVLEHAEDPAEFIKEHVRVSKRGYMETPSLVGELLFPKESHKWVILEIDGKLIIYEKARIAEKFAPDFGHLFLTYLPYKSIAMRLLLLTYGDLWTIRYEWEDEIEFIVNPEDEYYKSFFTKPWTDEMVMKLFPPKSIGKEIKSVLYAIYYICKCKIAKKFTNSRAKKLHKIKE